MNSKLKPINVKENNFINNSSDSGQKKGILKKQSKISDNYQAFNSNQNSEKDINTVSTGYLLKEDEDTELNLAMQESQLQYDWSKF